MKIKWKKSDYADSIYYADLFKIESICWMIMGYGKSHAASIASEKNRSNDLSRDCVAIVEEGKRLRGRYDPGAINPDVVKTGLFDFHDIDCVAYCLSPEQTDEFYGVDKRGIRAGDLESLAELSVTYQYPAYCAGHVFTGEEIESFACNKSRVMKFKDIVSNVDGINLLIVPFMDSVESKSKLYVDYSKQLSV